MTTIQSNNQTWCFVEVPDNGVAHELNENLLIFYLSFLEDDKLNVIQKCVKKSDPGCYKCYTSLPAGKWQLHAISNTITEDQAESIVGVSFQKQTYKGFPDFSDHFNHYSFALNSFHSLLRKHNLNGRYAIISKL